MPSLDKTTDHDLLRLGLVTIASVERTGPMFKMFECGLLLPEHDWSKMQDDLEDEPPYQFCRVCGQVRRA